MFYHAALNIDGLCLSVFMAAHDFIKGVLDCSEGMHIHHDLNYGFKLDENYIFEYVLGCSYDIYDHMLRTIMLSQFSSVQFSPVQRTESSISVITKRFWCVYNSKNSGFFGLHGIDDAGIYKIESCNCNSWRCSGANVLTNSIANWLDLFADGLMYGLMYG